MARPKGPGRGGCSRFGTATLFPETPEDATLQAMPDMDRRPYSTRLARHLRRHMTEPELRLWTCLRHDVAWKFRRQEPIGPYICDFVCYPKRLIVEADGIQHADNPADTVRDAYLTGLGFRVLRVWNGEVMTDLDGVLEAIGAALDSQPDHHRNRPPRDAHD